MFQHDPVIEGYYYQVQLYNIQNDSKEALYYGKQKLQEKKGEAENSLPGGASDLFSNRCEDIGDSGSSYCHKISLTRMEGLQPEHTDYQKKKKKNRRHWTMAKINSINLAKPLL